MKVSIREQISVLSDRLDSVEGKKQKKSKGLKAWKLPFKARAGAKKKLRDGKVLAIVLQSNRELNFKWADIADGLIRLGSYEFKAYDAKAIYHYRRIPVVVVFEWRLTPVGGTTEEAFMELKGGNNDVDLSKRFGLNSFAQQTVIRIIENAEILKLDGGKKAKKGISVVLIIIAVVVVVYLMSQGFGG